MSEFRFACPHCGQRIKGDSGYQGRQITCPSCQQAITVPAPAPREPKPAGVAPAPPPPGGAAAAGPVSPLALVSLVCSLGFGIGSIPGAVCGHLARARIRRDPALRGKGLATAGLIISYCSFLAAAALLVVGFFVLGPKAGHQLTAQEQAANTPAVLAARRVDKVTVADPESESAHQMKALFSRSGKYMNRNVRDAVNGGFISYVLEVDPVTPMTLYCTYWGNDNGGRHFDILVDNVVIATQRLEFNDPGHFFDEAYAIPTKLTRGKTKVTVVFQAYPGMTAGGLYGLQMLKR